MIEWKHWVKQLRRFDVEKTQKNPRGELVNISSILKIEFTSKFPRRIDDIVSTWIRWRINEYVSIGYRKIQILSIQENSLMFLQTIPSSLL